MESTNTCQSESSLTSHWTEKFARTEPFLQYKVVHASYFCNWIWSGWGQWHFSKGETLPVGAWDTSDTGICPHLEGPGWGVGNPWWPRSWLYSISLFGKPKHPGAFAISKFLLHLPLLCHLEKLKKLKNQCIVKSIFRHFSFGPPLETMKKRVV